MAEPKKDYRGRRPGPDWGPPTEISQAKDWVAIVLAIGMSIGINVFIIGVWITDYHLRHTLSPQSTQVLTTVFGGMIGVLGSYIGYKAGTSSERQKQLSRQQGRDQLLAEQGSGDDDRPG